MPMRPPPTYLLVPSPRPASPCKVKLARPCSAKAKYCRVPFFPARLPPIPSTPFQLLLVTWLPVSWCIWPPPTEAMMMPFASALPSCWSEFPLPLRSSDSLLWPFSLPVSEPPEPSCPCPEFSLPPEPLWPEEPPSPPVCTDVPVPVVLPVPPPVPVMPPKLSSRLRLFRAWLICSAPEDSRLMPAVCPITVLWVCSWAYSGVGSGSGFVLLWVVKTRSFPFRVARPSPSRVVPM